MDDLLALTHDEAVLVLTHDPRLVARCHRVVSLDDLARGRGPAPLPVG